MTAAAPIEEDQPTAPDGPQPWWRRAINAYLYGNQYVVTFLAFVVALVFGAVLIAIADAQTRTSLGYFFSSPGDTFNHAWGAISAAYSALFRGSIFNTNSLYSNGGVPVLQPISNTLEFATPLILGGLAVTVAFRAGLFNIGVQGQIIAGAICSGYVGFAWHLPSGIHLVVALLAGMVGGAVWAGIVGYLKAQNGAHEVITTIMMNYIAYYLLSYLLGLNGFQQKGSHEAVSNPVDGSAKLPHLFDYLHSGILVALLAAAIVWWVLNRSTFGFTVRAVGANAFAARTAGMNIKATYIKTMLLAGALAGLIGCTQVLGARGFVTQDIDGNFGFDAITVSLLGRGSPAGTVAAGLLFGALHAGGLTVNSDTHTPSDVVSVIEPVMVLFIAAPALIRGLFRLRAARSGASAGALAKGWNS